mmetsp:Transcript_17353/g.50458  ORF Transcript_17353/g.50458 Transcript_17353/m.50458 type:complete len:434 (+) Transcript_17353:709-2010(+)
MYTLDPAAAVEPASNSLDLDELFRDCYFGEFPVPPFAANADTAAVAASAPTPPAPPSAAATAAAATVEPSPVVAMTTTTTTTMAPAPPAMTLMATSVTVSQKRTAEQANLTTPSPSAAPSHPGAPAAVASAAANAAVPDASSSSSASPTPMQFAPFGGISVASSAGITPPSARPAPVLSDPAGGGVGADRRDSNASQANRELTEAQKVERRERNREHAKRSRLRKKFLLESLQEQIHGLMGEIDQLKDIIRTELPQKAEALIKKVEGEEKKYAPVPTPSGFGPVKTLMEPDYRLMSALSGSQQNFAISDPSLPDNPIVYVSGGFLELTGYTLDQVLGRNCRFLQGPGTDQAAVEVIRRGIREGVDTSVCLLNYKADGTPFWNQFFVAALRDAENNVVNFVGVQCEVSKAVVDKQVKDGKLPGSAVTSAARSGA